MFVYTLKTHKTPIENRYTGSQPKVIGSWPVILEPKLQYVCDFYSNNQNDVCVFGFTIPTAEEIFPRINFTVVHNIEPEH